MKIYINTILPFGNNLNTPKQPDKSPEPERATDTIASIYNGEFEYPSNYNAIIKEMMESDTFEDEFERAEIDLDVRNLIEKVGEYAAKKGRKTIYQSMLDEDGMPLKGFELGAVIQIGTNESYSNELLKKLIAKTKSQHSGLYTQNFADTDRTALFGVERYEQTADDTYNIQTEIFSKDGLVQKSNCEYKGRVVKSTFNKNRGQTVTVYEDAPYKKRIKYKRTIENNGSGNKTVKFLEPSELMAGTYLETTKQYLANGSINSKPKPQINYSNSTVYTETNQDVIYRQSYTRNGIKTERHFIKSPNGSTEQNYSITDENNNTLFKTNREFIKRPDGTAISIIDGKRYEISYDDAEMKIILKGDFGQRTIDIKDKVTNLKKLYCDVFLYSEESAKEALNDPVEVQKYGNTDEDKKELWAQAKEMSADMLIAFDNNIVFWTLSPDESYYVEGMLGTQKGDKTGTLGHELGHAIENTLQLKYDDEIIDTLFEEQINFIKTHSAEELNSLSYFFDNEKDRGEDKEYVGGIDEIFAETNCLMNAPAIEKEALSIRSKFLVECFPKTIALIANKYQEYFENSLQK